MTNEEHRMRLLKHGRIARVKRLLRWMPRKTNMHKYPVLRWFTKTARTRSYLWSFRVRTVVPALYAGCILALLPIYGIQLPLAVLLAFWLRANLPILTALQFVTNPITAVPAYFTAYQIGRAILNPLGIESPMLNLKEMNLLVQAIKSGNWGYQFSYMGTIWLITFLGGCVLGIFLGTVCSVFYRIAAYEVAVFNKKLRKLQQKLTESQPRDNLKSSQSSIHQNQ